LKALPLGRCACAHVVAAAHQREQLSRLRSQRDQAALEGAGRVVRLQLGEAGFEPLDAIPEGGGGDPLLPAVEGRVDAQALGGEHLGVVGLRELAPQQVEEVTRVTGLGSHRR
jgi:hypothetical protein